MIVLLSVGIPLLLILCCAGVVVVVPAAGLGLVAKNQSDLEKKIKPVLGTWTAGDQSDPFSSKVKLEIYDAGDFFLSYDVPFGECKGDLDKPKGQEFPITFKTTPCGPSEQAVTGESGKLIMNGKQLTLHVTGRADVVLTQG